MDTRKLASAAQCGTAPLCITEYCDAVLRDPHVQGLGINAGTVLVTEPGVNSGHMQVNL